MSRKLIGNTRNSPAGQLDDGESCKQPRSGDLQELLVAFLAYQRLGADGVAAAVGSLVGGEKMVIFS